MARASKDPVEFRERAPGIFLDEDDQCELVRELIG